MLLSKHGGHLRGLNLIYDSILDLIGKTPLVRYDENICLKLEFLNPSASIKARAAFSMIDEAIKRGDIDNGTVIIEPTSGNTGIALAMVCAYLGLELIICMPENMSEERKKAISAYGAKLVLTPASEGMAGSVKKSQELASQHENVFMPMQFSNPDNPKAHKATADEIMRDTDRKAKIVVAGIGTGGTAFGLKKFLPKGVKVIGVEPTESPLFTQGFTGAHKIQGIGANFKPEICNTTTLDRIVTVDSDMAIEEAKVLAKEQGIFAGISAGANLAAAKEIAKEFPNELIVVIIPDSGDRYLSVW
ncbi:MAG: cysteine synthase A [Cyanobacteria bacterium SIG31]|nr:cysteine synthase A [Cyanobacteria bacterium SIG31]